MNEEQGAALAKGLGPAARFWACDVSDTESIAAAVKGAAEWATATGKPLGGVIPAAGVGNPNLVSSLRVSTHRGLSLPGLETNQKTNHNPRCSTKRATPSL